MDEKIKKYTEDIERFIEKRVNKKLVEVLTKRLASVMGKTDAQFVSCSDPEELERVRRNFIKNKLNIDDIEKGRKTLKNVCEKMKSEKKKLRTTFYYLLILELRSTKKYLEG